MAIADGQRLHDLAVHQLGTTKRIWRNAYLGRGIGFGGQHGRFAVHRGAGHRGSRDRHRIGVIPGRPAGNRHRNHKGSGLSLVQRTQRRSRDFRGPGIPRQRQVKAVALSCFIAQGRGV